MDFSAAYTVKLNKQRSFSVHLYSRSKPIFNIPSYTLPTKLSSSHTYSSAHSIDNRFEVTIICACGSTCSNLLKPFSASILTGLVRSRNHSASTDSMHLYPPFLPAVCCVEFILWHFAMPLLYNFGLNVIISVRCLD
jgi:hypothetical protein